MKEKSQNANLPSTTDIMNSIDEELGSQDYFDDEADAYNQKLDNEYINSLQPFVKD